MYKQIKFFRLKQEMSLEVIRLGSSINELIKSGIVVERNSNGKKQFVYHKDENIQIGIDSGFVKSIYFIRESGWTFFKFDPYSFAYPATEPITEYFSKTHDYLKSIKTMDELKLQVPGNYLVLVFSDFIPTHIMLTRIN